MKRRGVTAALGAEEIEETPAKPAIACPRCKLPVRADVEFCNHCGAKVGEHKPVPWWHLHRRMYDWTLGWAYRPSAGAALFVLSFAESSFFPIPPDVLLMPLVLGNRRKWFRYAFLCSLASVLGAVAGFLIGWLAWESPLWVLTTFLGGIVAIPIFWFFYRKRPGRLWGGPWDLMIFGAGFGLGFLLGRLYPGTVAEFFFDIIPGFTPGVFERVSKLYEDHNFWIVFTAGFTPLPFKVITITAGVFGTGAAVASPVKFFVLFLTAATVSRSARFFLVAGLMRIFGPKITPFIEKYFNWLALLFAALLIGGFVVIKILAD